MEREHIHDLINVSIEALCLVAMFLYSAGVVLPGHYPEWLAVALPVSVIGLNWCYAFLKRGWRVFLRNCLYQLPIAGGFYLVLHGDMPEIICLYGWLTYSGTKTRFIGFEHIFSELDD